MHPHALLRDPNAPEPSGVSRIGAKRIWLFAAPYKWTIGLFISVITVQLCFNWFPEFYLDALLTTGSFPVTKLVTILALLTIAAALVEALFAIVER